LKSFLIEDRIYYIAEVYQCVNDGVPIAISKDTQQKIQSSRDNLNEVINSGKTIYGVNTGFGKLSQIRIKDNDLNLLQSNLLISHAVGVGSPCPNIIVKIMLLLKIVSFTKGNSGIRLEVVNFLLTLFNNNYLPLVPSKGSVGASGDLAPLSHLSLPLLGLGKIFVNGKAIDSIEVLSKIGLSPIELNSKEGLALINGTQFSTAYGVYCLEHIKDLLTKEEKYEILPKDLKNIQNYISEKV